MACHVRACFGAMFARFFLGRRDVTRTDAPHPSSDPTRPARTRPARRRLPRGSAGESRRRPRAFCATPLRGAPRRRERRYKGRARAWFPPPRPTREGTDRTCPRVRHASRCPTSTGGTLEACAGGTHPTFRVGGGGGVGEGEIGQSSQRFANPGTEQRSCGQRGLARFGRTSRAAAPMSGSSALRPMRHDIVIDARFARDLVREQCRTRGRTTGVDAFRVAGTAEISQVCKRSKPTCRVPFDLSSASDLALLALRGAPARATRR